MLIVVFPREWIVGDLLFNNFNFPAGKHYVYSLYLSGERGVSDKLHVIQFFFDRRIGEQIFVLVLKLNPGYH